MRDHTSSLSSVWLDTEIAVRAAYDRTSRRGLWRLRWTAAKHWQKLLFVLGFAYTIGVIFLPIINSSPADQNPWLVMPGVLMATVAFCLADRQAFGHFFRAYGEGLQPKRGEPSRLRYLCFLDGIKNNGLITAEHLRQLIPGLEARLNFQEHFFRRFPILSIVSAAIALVVGSALAQPPIWQSSVGANLTIVLAAVWVLVLIIERNWRELRPSNTARERELLSFVHMAVVDLNSQAIHHTKTSDTSERLRSETPS